jgi:HK97 family phage prohead protease
MVRQTDNLVRAISGESQLSDGDDEGPRHLHGHFAVFDRWAEIDSVREGHFLERIAPGAFKKTISEQRDRVKVLFDHGQDPQLGNKPLGKIDELVEDDHGVRYDVPLLDTDYNRGFIIPALEAGVLGASFRFRTIDAEWDDSPKRGDHNPQGLVECTIRELALYEFGPVTFPAYADATAGVRSMTDRFATPLVGPAARAAEPLRHSARNHIAIAVALASSPTTIGQLV